MNPTKKLFFEYVVKDIDAAVEQYLGVFYWSHMTVKEVFRLIWKNIDKHEINKIVKNNFEIEQYFVLDGKIKFGHFDGKPLNECIVAIINGKEKVERLDPVDFARDLLLMDVRQRKFILKSYNIANGNIEKENYFYNTNLENLKILLKNKVGGWTMKRISTMLKKLNYLNSWADFNAWLKEVLICEQTQLVDIYLKKEDPNFEEIYGEEESYYYRDFKVKNLILEKLDKIKDRIYNDWLYANHLI